MAEHINDMNETNESNNVQQIDTETEPQLTIEQTRELFAGLFQNVAEKHQYRFKEDLQNFTAEYRKSGTKGVVMLKYDDTKEMISYVKRDFYVYHWLDQKAAKSLGHRGINEALKHMNPKTNCVFVGAVKLPNGAYHTDCYRLAGL